MLLSLLILTLKNHNTIFLKKLSIMMKNYDESVEINHNPNWPYILDHPYRILVICGY